MRKKQSKDLTSNGNYAILHLACGRGGTGRRVRLRGVWETVWVQVPSTAPNRKDDNIIVFFSFSTKNDAALPLISKNSFQTHLKKTNKSHVKKSVT